ncbi:MAG: hypothetical protein P4M11_00180 [Candidatus Pacebacteria bacterium]|nr:hypothetical protein [Candidatus Paceibacterota bacterium]
MWCPFALVILFLSTRVLSWDYSQQTAWTTTCLQGSAQSPITISGLDSLGESEIRYILGYSYYNPEVPARMMDNGHYLVVSAFE